MCVVAVKYLKNFGWVGAKNRDRNYKTKIKVTQSNRYDVQRLYIDDQLSRWTEGINEYGVCIISASFSVKSDEKEGGKMLERGNTNTEPTTKNRGTPGYYSPDGRAVRTALLKKTPEAALRVLIDRELAGATYVFNESECWLLEGGFTVKKGWSTKDNPRKYIYKTTRLNPQKISASTRTNHGIDLPMLGYKKDPTDEQLIRSRKSSETRHKYVCKFITAPMTDPSQLVDALAKSPDKDTFMNPIRTGDPAKGDMVTTGQLLLVPKTRTLHYRPLYSAVEFEYDRLNLRNSKTYFEIISSRKLLSFTKFINR